MSKRHNCWVIKNYQERYLMVKTATDPDLKDVRDLMKAFKVDRKLQQYLANSNQLEENFAFFSKMIGPISQQKLKPGSQEIIKFYGRPGSIKQLKKSLSKQSAQNFSVQQPSVPVLQKPLEQSVPLTQPLRAPKRFERMSSSSLRSEALKLMQHYPKECSHSKRLEMLKMFYFLLKELSDRYFYDARQTQLPRYPNFSQDNALFMVELVNFTNQHTQQLSAEIGEIQEEIETISNPINLQKIDLKLEIAFVLLNTDLSIFYLGLMNAGFVEPLARNNIGTLLYFHYAELQALKQFAKKEDQSLIMDAMGNIIEVMKKFKIPLPI